MLRIEPSVTRSTLFLGSHPVEVHQTLMKSVLQGPVVAVVFPRGTSAYAQADRSSAACPEVGKQTTGRVGVSSRAVSSFSLQKQL